MALGVVGFLLATHSVQAFYNSSNGRWLNRDPVEEQGGENVYGFAGNSPLQFIDLLGLEWKVSRERRERALAVTDCPDTVTSLAFKVGLDEDEYRNWLKAEDGLGLPSSASELIPSSRKFSVPNKFLVVVGDVRSPFLGNLVYNMLLLRAIGLSTAAEQYGYDVKYMDYQISPFNKAEILAQKSNLHGMIFMGHGTVYIPWVSEQEPGQFVYSLDADEAEYIRSSEMRDVTAPNSYGYGFVAAKFCSSGEGKWRSAAARNGRYWVTWGKVTLPFIAQFRYNDMIETLKRQSGK